MQLFPHYRKNNYHPLKRPEAARGISCVGFVGKKPNGGCLWYLVKYAQCSQQDETRSGQNYVQKELKNNNKIQ